MGMLLRLLVFFAVASWIWRVVRRSLQPSIAQQPPSLERNDAFKVLGVESTASADELRAAYRQKLTQYHPDKVAGLGQELQDLARRKTESIIAAYRLLTDGRMRV